MSVARWLTVVSSISDHPHTLTSIDDFIRRLESELIKIQGLHCELPVCMLLLKDAIIVMREESKRKAKPVLQEFISSKKEAVEEPNKNKCNEDSRDKGDWLSSVQLWSVDARSDAQRHTYVREIEKVENRANMFTVRHNVVGQPYQHRPYLIAPTTTAKNVDLGGAASAFPLHMPTVGHRMSNVSNPGVRKSGVVAPDSTNRKQRRCWSQELHRSFVNALQQLGGAQVATPKQIRDLMRVDGLTNDEVKSHLQKYRLHARKGGLYESSKTEESPSKASSRRSGSPKSAFQFSLATGGRSTTGLDSMEDEHNRDDYRWKDYNYIQTQKGSILNNN